MGFYMFSQNNSGGHFVGPKYVIVEANSHDEANWRATHYGPVYFDGCEKDIDCSCCGDRWHEIWAYERPDAEPSLYGKPIAEYDGWRSGEVLIIRADGSTETVEIHGKPL